MCFVHPQSSEQNSERKPVILLGHLDTVWVLGTLQHMPLDITRDRIHGPGVLDMKAGVLMALTAVEIARANDAAESDRLLRRLVPVEKA